MAGKLRTPREIAHELMGRCYLATNLGKHSPGCDKATAAIQAHEDAVREEDAGIVRSQFFPEADSEHFVVMTAALNGAAATIMSKRSKEARQRDLDDIGGRSLRSRGTPHG